MKYLIIGGVAGGATAAARIRRVDESAQVILFEKGKYISYANCGLPYYIGGTIEERGKLFLQTPQSFGKRFRIDVRVENEVISINPQSKSVEVRRADGETYVEFYDKLLLSTGAVPFVPPFPGVGSEGIFTLRNVEDTDRIKAYLTSGKVNEAIVVGAGFIGLEMAENLHEQGAEVSVVEMGDQVMAPVDFSVASHVHQHLIQKGVHLYLSTSVERFEKRGEKIVVFFSSGESIETDLVILSIGVRPETTLAKKAGLKIGETGGIWVDEFLQSSVEDIYAVGDAIEFPHPITGKPWMNYLANPANRQGRIVADNMLLGNTISYEGAIGTSIAKVFDMTVASTGLSEKKLKQLGTSYASSTTHGASHAGYYPNALPLSIKLTFDPATGRLYGGQCVGFEGVDKRIDQIALLIKNKGTIEQLTQLEHCYAPPFSSAKDPIAIAGYVASNIMSGVMPVVTWRQVAQAARTGVLLLDVRTKEEHAFGAIPGSVNIPVDELRERIDEIGRDREIYVYCAVGLRGYLALKILKANGFTQVKNLSGGYKTYSTAMAPLNGKKTRNKQEYRVNMDTQRPIEEKRKLVKVDASGLQCPGPILRIKQEIDAIEEGERVEMISTDAGFSRDAQAWCNTTGHILISNTADKGKYKVLVEKSSPKACKTLSTCDGKGKTMILFSDDLDKALATFVLANGAAATGQKVTIFFTFWGLNVIKKVRKPKVKKDFFGIMFGMMLPSSSLKLRLSKMSMFGIGDRMMRHIMKKKGIASLETLREEALKGGVEFIACQMSMDVMGLVKEELLEEVTIGGVATYMERADEANVNLFV